jgi:hypothetical protein
MVPAIGKGTDMRQGKVISATVVIVAWLLSAAPGFAQREGLRNTSPEERARVETFFMKRKLNLTPKQTEKVRAINMKYAREMDPIIKGSEGKLRKLRQARDIEHDKDADLHSVLSPGQYQRYLASKEEIRRKVMERF